MPHSYVMNIVEIREEYTTFLINIMAPFVFEGIQSIYQHAVKINQQLVEKKKDSPTVVILGVLKLFQICLKEVPTLNNHLIEQETNRIKEGSKCSEWFDDLVRAVIKANIVLLTFTTSKQRSELVMSKYHEQINIHDFIHKVYIECARAFYNNPELFWTELPTIEIRRNRCQIIDIIKNCIKEGIRKILPRNQILKEFLRNEYVDTEVEPDVTVSENRRRHIENKIRHESDNDLTKSDKNLLDGIDSNSENGYEEVESGETEESGMTNTNDNNDDDYNSSSNVGNIGSLESKLQKIHNMNMNMNMSNSNDSRSATEPDVLPVRGPTPVFKTVVEQPVELKTHIDKLGTSSNGSLPNSLPPSRGATPPPARLIDEPSKFTNDPTSLIPKSNYPEFKLQMTGGRLHKIKRETPIRENKQEYFAQYMK